MHRAPVPARWQEGENVTKGGVTERLWISRAFATPPSSRISSLDRLMGINGMANMDEYCSINPNFYHYLHLGLVAHCVRVGGHFYLPHYSFR